MATTVLGFRFVDESFFNCEVPAANWRRMRDGHAGNWEIQGMVADLARNARVALTSNYVCGVTEGGILAEVVGLNQLVLGPQQDPTSAGAENSEQVGAQEEASKCASDEKATSHVWTEEQVRLLIETYRNRKHLFQRTTLAKTEVWRKIATDMAEFGSLHSPTACQKKWDNLCSRYKTIVERHNKTGSSRKSWAYFDLMADILSKNPAITPPLTVSSLDGPVVHAEYAADDRQSETDPPPAPPASRFERPSSSPSPGAFHTYRRNSARPLSYPPTHSQAHQVPCPSPSPVSGCSHLAGPKKGRSAGFPSVSHEVRPLPSLSPIAHPSLSPSPDTLGSNRPGRCSTSPILHLAPSPSLVVQPSSSPSPDTLVSNGPSRWSAIQVSHPSPSLSPVSHPSASSSKDSRPDQGRRPSTDTADGENTTPKRRRADSHAALREVGASVSAALQRMAMAMERRNELLAKYLGNQEN